MTEIENSDPKYIGQLDLLSNIYLLIILINASVAHPTNGEIGTKYVKNDINNIVLISFA